MIRIELVSLETLELYRRTRLAALRDTPLAFGSTYEKESAFDDSVWRERIARNQTDQSCCYLAIDDETDSALAAGLAGVFVENDPTRGTLFSMWVAPTYRRNGVGQKLVEACLDWCRARKIRTIDLLVTDWNAGATRFYERLGFTRTGKAEPYPNAANMVEYEMIRKV
jgi:ribosomal protein S18 acetylase RimI-like enzyme